MDSSDLAPGTGRNTPTAEPGVVAGSFVFFVFLVILLKKLWNAARRGGAV